jgi:hypothetical protein
MPVEHLSAIPQETTAQSILNGLQKAMMLLAEKAARRPKKRLVVDAAGRPVFETKRDRLGDIMRIHRALPPSEGNYSGADLRAIRAQKGVGRPPMGWAKVLPHMQALREHGGQRAAARALGIHLSTFQRRLAKEQAA